MAGGIDIQKFVGGVIGAVVVVLIVVTVAVPVISDNLLPEGEGAIDNAGAINSMLEVIPLLLVVAIIIAIVGMFLYNRKN